MQYAADNQDPRTRQARQRGTSLVEVLVVLVILVLGIFSIARLFPGGFFTIRSAENNTFADRLAQAQLETLKQNSAFLLDGVYVFNPTGTTNNLTGTLDPSVKLNDLNNDYLPTDPTYNDINKARYIKGERFTVPVAGQMGLPIHLLNYGPVVLPATTSLAYPSITSAPWTAQTGSSQPSPSDLNRPVDDPNDLLQSAKPNYLIDYTNGKIAVPPAAFAQKFVFQVQSNGNTFTVLLNIPAMDTAYGTLNSSNYDGGWFDPTALYQTNITNATTGATATSVPLPWTIGTASLVRPLAAVSSINLSAPDPYQVAMPPATLVSSTIGMGVLEFDPRLVGQQMSASYLTDDWHIIHEDIDVPAITTTFGSDTSVSSASVRLTLNHLQRVGDVLDAPATPGGSNTSSVYPGLFSNAAAPFDIVLLDTDTGQMQGLSATSVGPTGAISDSDNDSTAPQTGQFAVSYLNGRIILPAKTATGVAATQAWVSVPHKHLRVFYAGDYGWAVALQKNPSLYTRGSFGALNVDQFAADPANPTHLVFPISDLGQSVEVDQITYTDTNNMVHQVATASGAISTDFAGTNYIDLSPFLTNIDTTKPITVGSVRGISARAVVIWKERDQWKSRTIGTILNRS